ncbi:ankyrin repeat protein [Cotonvirus japonicus]|uniref:Ankyrin repeat protein n=1 Tax=Cotonvirus japonicus TaxID=2811091 RepID=A0ABM7NR63_9VIRU|nr:ankyrin repeat protein [Cotonvirus japonicus]BCS82649.1 ankyrin repeat protein [Cotonvirus japonicus]
MHRIKPYDYNKSYDYCYNGKCRKFTKLMWLIINEYKIKKGHRKIIQYLKKRKNLEKINHINEHGWTALMIASIMSNKWSSYSTVKLLIKLGANVNVENIYGCTALMLAARNSNTTSSLQTVKLLLDNHADVELKSSNTGHTALMYACWYADTDSTIETVKLLLDRGASINSQNNENDTPLMLVLRHNTNNLIETVELLLNREACVNSKNKNNQTPLMIAVSRCNIKDSVKVVELLLKYGADMEYRNVIGLSIFNYACIYAGKYNRYEITDLLLNNGANIKSVSNFGMTTLMVSCVNILDTYNSNIIEYLLNYGVNINLVCDNGYTALACVLLSSPKKIIDISLRLKYAEILLQHGANPNIFCKTDTILRKFLRNNGNYKIVSCTVVRLLLRYNLNTNIIVDGINDLLWIAKNIKSENKLQLLSLLLEYGADEKVTDEEGHTFIDFLDNDEILHCMGIIDDIKLKKNNMNIVIKSIPEIVPQYIYDVNSFSVQLLNLKWNIDKYNSKENLPESHLKYYDYLNAVDMEDFRDKINDAVKQIY